MGSERELDFLSQHPHFQERMKASADGPKHPVSKVRKAVYLAAKHPHTAELMGWPAHEHEQRARVLADHAAQHAQAALQEIHMGGGAAGGASGSAQPMPAAARGADNGNLQGENLQVAPNVSGGNVRDLLLIRHGETDMNESATSGNSVDKIRGHDDIPLNEAGKKQANVTGDHLAQSGPKPDAMVSSDLCRAKLTAQIISQKTGVPVAEVSDHFRPWDAGRLTGQASEKAVPVMAQFAEKAPNQKLPGGESFNAFRTRFFVGLADALQKHQGLLAVVSHHRNERLLHAWQAAGFPADGSIDTKTFNKKGEATGKAQLFKIPVDRAIAAAKFGLQTGAAQGEPTNFYAARRNERPGQE